jgi:transposase
MTHYAALDVSLRSVAICVVDGNGDIKLERSVDSEVEDIVHILRSFDGEITSVGLEAGVLTQHLTYGLQAADYEVVCMEARQVKAALSAMRNKTDKNDARGIAQILRTGWYSRVHVKSMASHHVRALLSRRRAVLKKCVDLENEVRGLLKIFGIKLPGQLGHRVFDSTVRGTIEADAALAHALIPMLEARGFLYQTFVELDRRVKAMARADTLCQLLMTAPGVGPITALTYKAAVDDPRRFKSSRTVAAHFGLTPRRFQSGEVDRLGHISKAGDADVRTALYTAANSLMTRTVGFSTLKAWGMHLMKTKGRRVAVIAVARKLAVILHRMWIDGTEFQWGTEGANT